MVPIEHLLLNYLYHNLAISRLNLHYGLKDSEWSNLINFAVVKVISECEFGEVLIFNDLKNEVCSIG